MILPFLSAKSRQTSKSKISNRYLKPFPRNNTLKSVALAVALSVVCVTRGMIRAYLIFKHNFNNTSYKLSLSSSKIFSRKVTETHQM